ncbi:MAG: ABC transporter ATP-binding protein [Epulopiscium sp.]|nr:ABC transporter ATP-binding protein [Candidatus Epulonipiscium sp.]
MQSVECNNLTKRYGSVYAVNDLSFSIAENSITGLIGRNGAGKTTLLKMLAGFSLPTSGTVNIFGQNPFNNLLVSANLIFIDDEMVLPENMNLGEILKAAATFYENWQAGLASGLLDYFSLDLCSYYPQLSKGMKSTFNMILGIAARCPITIFDEPTVGMDAAVRKDFYRALLKDYLQQPRTIILSSHLLVEIEDLLDNILLIDAGEKRLHLPMDELRSYAVGLTGNFKLLNELVKKEDIIFQQQLGKDKIYLVVRNRNIDFSAAKLKGLEISPVAANDLCVYLTAKHKGGIDDVFKYN